MLRNQKRISKHKWKVKIDISKEPQKLMNEPEQQVWTTAYAKKIPGVSKREKEEGDGTGGRCDQGPRTKRI